MKSMRPAWPHPRTGEGAVLIGILALLLLEMIALGSAPTHQQPLVGGVLLGTGVLALLVVTVLLRRRRASGGERAAQGPGGEPFEAEALQGFPAEAVQPLLLGPNAPSLNTLHTAWVFATQGRDAVWIERHLNLPADLAHLLVDTADRQGRLPQP